MGIDSRILSELKRYNYINKYITEQEIGDVPPPPPPPLPGEETGIPPTGEETPPVEPSPETTPEPIDVEQDPDIEKIDSTGNSEEEGGDTEELEITDLVNAQEKIQTKQDEYFDNLFKQLENLTSKLSEMDKIVDKVNSIEQKIEKYRVKTPEEKLELRSLDSYPYNQKLTDFFVDKESDLEKSGKNEYVLTSDEVTDFSPSEIKKTFTPPTEFDGSINLNKY